MENRRQTVLMWSRIYNGRWQDRKNGTGNGRNVGVPVTN